MLKNLKSLFYFWINFLNIKMWMLVGIEKIKVNYLNIQCYKLCIKE
jgi:hypothetical protein